MTSFAEAAKGVAPVFGGGFPMSYLRTFGPRADPVTSLGWGLGALSLFVIILVTGLVVTGALRRGHRAGGPVGDLPVSREGPGLRWIQVGVGLTLAALLASVIWTVEVMAQINSPSRPPAATIEVTGHQWWWEVVYDPQGPHRFSTANEIHIPVGQPVLLKLKSADVIHSFWIPTLTGKTDTIPGRANLSWIEADHPGIYRGQCAEYCGLQHAHMGLIVIADEPAAFAAWRQAQSRPAPEPGVDVAAAGRAILVARCGGCHTVRGTAAGGIVGPDLTHLASRLTLAADALPNTVAGLSGWIENPQAIKPGTHMPAMNLPPAELAELRAYLETLQ